MKKIVLSSILAVISMSSFAQSASSLPLSAFSSEILKNTEALAPAPIENSDYVVFANSIAGPREVLKSNNCQTVVSYLRPLVGSSPRMIMDGGYFVQVNQKYILRSSDYSLFVWMEKCEKLVNIK